MNMIYARQSGAPGRKTRRRSMLLSVGCLTWSRDDYRVWPMTYWAWESRLMTWFEASLGVGPSNKWIDWV